MKFGCFRCMSSDPLYHSELFFRKGIRSSCFGGSSCRDALSFQYKSGRSSRTFVSFFASAEKFPTMVQQLSKPGAKEAHLLKAGHPPAGKRLSSLSGMHWCLYIFLMYFFKKQTNKKQRVVAVAARFRPICPRINSAAPLSYRGNAANIFLKARIRCVRFVCVRAGNMDVLTSHWPS